MVGGALVVVVVVVVELVSVVEVLVSVVEVLVSVVEVLVSVVEVELESNIVDVGSLNPYPGKQRDKTINIKNIFKCEKVPNTGTPQVVTDKPIGQA